MNDEILTWEITPTEQRGENQKILIFLFSSLPIFIGIIISATFASKENFFIKNQLQVVKVIRQKVIYGVTSSVSTNMQASAASRNHREIQVNLF